jgi:hypothetical protein
LNTRDLNTLFAHNNEIKKEMFPGGGSHLTTLIAIVGQNAKKDFLNSYERLSEGIVPRSALTVPVKADIGQVELIRVVCLGKFAEDIKTKCKSELKYLF